MRIEQDIVLSERGGALDPPRGTTLGEDEMETEIDRDVDGTFPASDPPGWSPGMESGYSSRDLKPDDADSHGSQLPLNQKTPNCFCLPVGA